MTDQIMDLKKRFAHSYEFDQIIAQRCVAEYIENLHLQDLSPKHKIRKLTTARRLLFLEADASKRKDYLGFAGNEHCLYNVFSGNHLIYHCDEEQQMLEGIILFEKIKCVQSLLAQEKRQLPDFKYINFMKGDENILFFELHERPLRTSQKDYHKMRCWQIQKMWQCVNLDFELLRNEFIETVEDNPLFMDVVQSNIQLLNEVFLNCKTFTANQLYTHLSKLTGLLPGALPDDKMKFHRLFCLFDPEKNVSHSLNPQLISLAHEQILKGKLSNAPICCWSLIRFKRWLSDILKGKMELNDPPGGDYELLVEQIYEKAQFKNQNTIDAFKLRYPKGSVTKKSYKLELLDKMKELRYDFNQLKDTEYYQLLPNRENTTSYFIDQCCVDIDSATQVHELSKSIEINGMIKFYTGELSRIDESLVKPTLDIRIIKYYFEEIISAMIPNPEISEQLWKAFNKFSRTASRRKPHLFKVEDLKDAMLNIFQKSFINFNKMWDGQPGHIIESYMQNQLNELELMALVAPEFGEDLLVYLKKIKKLFKIKRKSFPIQQSGKEHINENLSPEMQMQVIEKSVNKIISFGCKKSPGFLTPYIQELNDKIHFLDPRTTIENFIRIVFSDNLNSIQDKIYLGCKTNEFRYLIKYFKAFFKSFNPATIGKSGLFISNTGIPITATNLNSAMIESMKTRYAIDNIFNKKQ